MTLPPSQRAVWQALRHSRVQLASSNVNLPGILRNVAQQKPKDQRSGMRPQAVVEQLTTAGLDAIAAEQAAAGVIAKRFPAFASSWQAYISNGGYLFDLWRLPDERRDEIASQLKLDRLVELTAEAASNPIMTLSNFPLLQELSQLSSRVNNREDPGNPARIMLVEAHGFPPELATAVMLYSRAVPWWVHPIIVMMVLVCVGVFILAIAEPNSEVFHTDDFDGANWVHYTVLPLFAFAMTTVEVYLLRNRKRWDRAWQDALATWRATGSNP